jgi:hypothetical protein
VPTPLYTLSVETLGLLIEMFRIRLLTGNNKIEL